MNDSIRRYDAVGWSDCDKDLNSATNYIPALKLLDEIVAKGCTPPKVLKSCCYDRRFGVGGYFEETDNTIYLCCRNKKMGRNGPDVWAYYHEMIHVRNRCPNKNLDCDQIICDEIVAYYYAICKGRWDRRNCAIQGAKVSMQDRPCEPLLVTFTRDDFNKCLDKWENSQSQ
jgi:hypothetical protein